MNVKELKNILNDMDNEMELVINILYKENIVIIRDIELEVIGDEEKEIVIGGKLENWE